MDKLKEPPTSPLVLFVDEVSPCFRYLTSKTLVNLCLVAKPFGQNTTIQELLKQGRLNSVKNGTRLKILQEIEFSFSRHKAQKQNALNCRKELLEYVATDACKTKQEINNLIDIIWAADFLQSFVDLLTPCLTRVEELMFFYDYPGYPQDLTSIFTFFWEGMTTPCSFHTKHHTAVDALPLFQTQNAEFINIVGKYFTNHGDPLMDLRYTTHPHSNQKGVRPFFVLFNLRAEHVPRQKSDFSFLGME